MVAEENEPLVEPSHVRAPPLAVGSEPPFEHRARDVQRAGDDPVPLAVAVGADVDQHGAPLESGLRLLRGEALDSRPGIGEQVLERPSSGLHRPMMPSDVPLVGLSA